MSTTRTSPASSVPGISTTPVFAAPNVTVSAARTAVPPISPVAPFTPLGMSTDTTGTPQPSIASIASAQSSSGCPLNPVPNTASITASARSSSLSKVLAVNRRTRTPAAASLRWLVAAGSRMPSGLSSVTTVTLMPHRDRCLAATYPSPPLFPLPQTTTTRRPYVPPSRSATARATDQPALSIRVSAAIPRP